MFLFSAVRNAVFGSAVIPHSGTFVSPIDKGTAYAPPAAFSVGDWSLTNPVTDGDLAVTVSSLPLSSDTIEDIEYRVDSGTWVSSGGTTSFTISGLTNGVSVSVELRTVNRHGISDPSDIKSETPTAV